MPTTSQHKEPLPYQSDLQSLGVMVPIRLSPLKVLPGRHPLGRSGNGLRFLRTRPFQQGEDNPRDVDKFSPPGDRQVIEWEEEAQASIMVLADVSASMALSAKSALRNAALLQITYSLWRAGDRVGTQFFNSGLHQVIRHANLKTQMERLAQVLATAPARGETDIASVLDQFLRQHRRHCPDVLFLVSDFVALEGPAVEPGRDWRSLLGQLRQNLIPVVITFEVPPDTRGMVKLWDPERRSRRLTWFSGGRVREINREERRRVDELTMKFRSAGLDYLVLSSQRQIYPQLARLARQRRGRKN